MSDVRPAHLQNIQGWLVMSCPPSGRYLCVCARDSCQDFALCILSAVDIKIVSPLHTYFSIAVRLPAIRTGPHIECALAANTQQGFHPCPPQTIPIRSPVFLSGVPRLINSCSEELPDVYFSICVKRAPARTGWHGCRPTCASTVAPFPTE